MSWSTGLKRVSLVWWGFWVLSCLGFGLFGLVQDRAENALPVLFGALIPAALHKITCWVIEGFTKS